MDNIATRVRETLNEVRNQRKITFQEEDHKYEMLGKDGKLVSHFPSVSNMIEFFYEKFDAKSKALQMCNNNEILTEELLEKWDQTMVYAANLGSRTHYYLEQESLRMFGIVKEVRQPEFSCDVTQTMISDNMVEAGKKFLNLMKSRGAQIVDTEVVMGSNDLEYFGQDDTLWVMESKVKGEYGFVISDYKSNKQKNFEIHPYTKRMLTPFSDLYDTALNHYFLQLPFYGKLLLDMLKDTEFSNMKMLGYLVVHLKDDKTFQEYRVPKTISDKVFSLNFPLKNLD